ncbi:hypothetical protein ACE1SV_04060 [Streptomyces sp. E-15]
MRSPPATRLRSSAGTVPSPATSTDPKGSSPAPSASRASSTQRRRYRIPLSRTIGAPPHVMISSRARHGHRDRLGRHLRLTGRDAPHGGPGAPAAGSGTTSGGRAE